MNAKTFRIFAVASAFLLLTMALTPQADAQKKLQVSPGGLRRSIRVMAPTP